MAEPLSLAASIAALGGLLVTVARFAHEMSGYYEDLLRYYMTLEIIQRVRCKTSKGKYGNTDMNRQLH
jgi:hypothetical protein